MDYAKIMFVEGMKKGGGEPELVQSLNERFKDIECTKHLLSDPRLDLAAVHMRYDFIIIALYDVSDDDGNRFLRLHQQLMGLKNFLDDLESQRRILYGCKVLVVPDVVDFPYQDYLRDMLLDAEKRLVNMTLSLVEDVEICAAGQVLHPPSTLVDRFTSALMLMKPVSSKFKIN